MERYNDLMEAVGILSIARQAISDDDGPTVTSPAWTMVHHALTYIVEQADTAMRGVEVQSVTE